MVRNGRWFESRYVHQKSKKSRPRAAFFMSENISKNTVDNKKGDLLSPFLNK